jgi:hypothetical protein
MYELNETDNPTAYEAVDVLVPANGAAAAAETLLPRQ